MSLKSVASGLMEGVAFSRLFLLVCHRRAQPYTHTVCAEGPWEWKDRSRLPVSNGDLMDPPESSVFT